MAKLFKVTGTLERFARYKSGEELETLLAEAKALEEKRNTNPRTTLPAGGVKGKPSKKQKAAAEKKV